MNDSLPKAAHYKKVYSNQDVHLIYPVKEFRPEESVTSYKNWGLADINVQNLRALASTRKLGRNVKVAIIDTGGCFTHPDLKSVYKGSYNGIDPTKPASDDNGHGCHVSGTVGGDPSYSVGGGFVDLYAGKFLASNGSGGMVAAIKATQAAIAWGADVISNSWGGGNAYQPYTDLVTQAEAKGVIFTFAAGNDSKQTASYPSSIAGAISVASHTSNDQMSSFSNWGPQVWISMPGSNIYSTWNDGSYNTISGTSMATPHAAGVAALLLESGLKPIEVIKAMQTTYAIKANWVKYGRDAGKSCP